MYRVGLKYQVADSTLLNKNPFQFNQDSNNASNNNSLNVLDEVDNTTLIAPSPKFYAPNTLHKKKADVRDTFNLEVLKNTVPHRKTKINAPVHKAIPDKKTKSLYNGNELTTKVSYSEGILLFTIVLLFAFFRYYYRKFFSEQLKSFFSINYYNQSIRSEDTLINRATFFFYCLFILVLGLTLFKSYQLLVNIPFSFMLFLKFTGALVIIYFFKHIGLMILGNLTETYSVTNAYNFQIMNTNIILGWCLLPILLMLYFYNGLSVNLAKNIIITAFLAFLIFRFFKGFQISFSSNLPKFYIILYLCTLEILPLVVIIKLFIIKIV